MKGALGGTRVGSAGAWEHEKQQLGLNASGPQSKHELTGVRASWSNDYDFPASFEEFIFDVEGSAEGGRLLPRVFLRQPETHFIVFSVELRMMIS